MVLLETRNIEKRFGGLLVLKNVSFEVKKGEILSLIGPNGAGKTSLFNILTGFLKPTSGDIFYKGRLWKDITPEKMCASGIARTFQVVKPLNGLTVLENITVGSLLKYKNLRQAMRKAHEVVEYLDLLEHKDKLASSLPIGLRKKLEIAKSIATEPELLLLDEPMGGLNSGEVEEMIKLIRQFRDNGLTIVLVEHVMKAVMNLSDRVLVLNQGVIIANGKPEEVSRAPAVIAAYLGE